MKNLHPLDFYVFEPYSVNDLKLIFLHLNLKPGARKGI